MALVLIVDDDEMSLALLEVILERAGYGVIKANDGENALNLAYTLRPDVVIVDDQMPGLSGIQVSQQLKQEPELAYIPVVLSTAGMYVDNGAALLREAGANALLHKPWLKHDVETVIRRFVTERT